MAEDESSGNIITKFHKSETYKQLATAVNRITNSLDADRSTLFLIDAKKNQLVATVAEGVNNIEIRVNIGEGMAGLAAKKGTIMNEGNPYRDSDFATVVDESTGYKTESILAVPLHSKEEPDKIIGVIEVLNKKEGTFNKDDEEILKMFASVISMVIETKIKAASILPEE